MGYKIKGALKRGKGKNVFIVMIVLWIIVSIVLIAPITISIVDATQGGTFNFDKFLEGSFSNFGSIGSNLGKVFSGKYIGTFSKGELWSGIILLAIGLIGLFKSAPKNEYTDIEHGSSDWAEGEEYEILSNKTGIILAEKHYLPVDKRGNVNVLVVGRFWFR